MEKTYDFYTDGAATMKKVNGEYVREAGGWAFAFKDNGNIYCSSGHEDHTTNQAMELRAIYEALLYYWKYYFSPSAATTLKIYSDSAYSINICTTWRFGWKRNEWQRKGNKPIENLEIIKKIDELLDEMNVGFNNVEFVKVKGHNGDEMNELVDQFAVNAKKTGKEVVDYFCDKNNYICGKRRELPIIDDIGPDREELEEIIKPLLTYPCGRKLEITEIESQS